MNYLYQKLPKDLVNIVEEYAKDRTNYDKVMTELDGKILLICFSICPYYNIIRQEKNQYIMNKNAINDIMKDVWLWAIFIFIIKKDKYYEYL